MISGNNHDNLTAAFIDKIAVIRVEGRGSFKISPPLKQFIHQVVSERSAEKIRIDMSDCSGMDSTFMGVLAGLSCFVKKESDLSMKLINLSEKNHKLLVTLGVDRVVTYTLAGGQKKNILDQADGVQKLETDFSNKLEAAKTTLEAHETLVNINPDNFAKFKSVLEFLENDVQSLTH